MRRVVTACGGAVLRAVAAVVGYLCSTAKDLGSPPASSRSLYEPRERGEDDRP